MKIEIDESKLFKGFAKGFYDPEHGGTIIMYADELYKNNRPHVEFCHFCILRNLLVPVSKEILELNPEMTENDMIFDVEWIFILKSDDEERNKEIEDMLKKWVSCYKMEDRERFELFYGNVYPLKEIKPKWLKSKYVK